MKVPEQTPRLHDLMRNHGRLMKSSRRQVIQTTDSQRQIFLVKSGYIKRYLIKNDGSIGVDLIYGPGDLFSLTLIFSKLYNKEILDSPETHYYETLSKVEMYALGIDDFGPFVEEDPLIYRDLLEEAGKRMTYETHGLENISMKNSYKRVAHQLAYYARLFGEVKGDEAKILPILTHQDIADILNLTRETVSTCMIQLRKNKLIRTKISRQIVIPNLPKLMEEAFE